MSQVMVGALSGLPSDTGTCVDVDGTTVAVFRVDGDVFALANRCSHAEASLCEGEVFDGEVECPLHGAAFDITSGKALTLPATQPVATFRTEVQDGNVYVFPNNSEDNR